jgi:protein arginine N-methyltransferase 1
MESGQSCDFYFNSFKHFTAHEELMTDEVRTKAWHDAIERNPSLFHDKVVADAGCGLCLLTMFMLKHNPSRCYGIEKSTIFQYACEVISVNGLSGRVEIIHADVEDVNLDQKVDTIVCDFVNCCGIFDSMLPALITFRNKWLKPDGRVFPTMVTVAIAGINLNDYSERVNFWQNVYGFDFQCIGDRFMNEALFVDLTLDSLVTGPFVFWAIESKTIQREDLNVHRPFTFKGIRSAHLNAFAIWFDTKFVGPEHTTEFSTSPYAEQTIYSQTVLLLRDAVEISEGEGVTGTVTIQMSEREPRNLDITINYSINARSWSQSYVLKV